MSSLWWEQWPLLVSNDTSPSGFLDNSTCFSSTQSTVLNGVPFGGVPVVLLLDFSVFLVCICLSVCDQVIEENLVTSIICVSSCVVLKVTRETDIFCLFFHCKNCTRTFSPSSNIKQYTQG